MQYKFLQTPNIYEFMSNVHIIMIKRMTHIHDKRYVITKAIQIREKKNFFFNLR